MNRKKNNRQVLPKDKPKSYWMDHNKQVWEYIRSKVTRNPQRERENQEFNTGKLEVDPGK